MKDILKPILVLASICLVVTALLAFVNGLTKPVILAAEEQAAIAAKSEVLSEASSFEPLELTNLPAGVVEIDKGNDNTGYVVITQVKGYGGNMRIITGIRPNGTIEAVKTLSHNETTGVGTRAVDNHSPYREQFVGKNATRSQKVDTISGATISSTAYKKAIGLAFSAYQAAKEAGL